MQSLLILFQYKGTLYTSHFEPRYFDLNEEFKPNENGLQFAFGIVNLSPIFFGEYVSEISLEELYEVRVWHNVLSEEGFN